MESEQLVNDLDDTVIEPKEVVTGDSRVVANIVPNGFANPLAEPYIKKNRKCKETA